MAKTLSSFGHSECNRVKEIASQEFVKPSAFWYTYNQVYYYLLLKKCEELLYSKSHQHFSDKMAVSFTYNRYGNIHSLT